MNLDLQTETQSWGCVQRSVMLCLNHKLEVWKRGYGSAEGIVAAIPTAYRKQDCSICNGTWAVNQALSHGAEHNHDYAAESPSITQTHRPKTNMGWTEQNLRDYTQRRLKDEQRTRTTMLSKAIKRVKSIHERNGYNSAVVTAFFKEHGIPEPLYEYQFCADRKWRFDISWDGLLRPVAIEVQGGIFSGGAHVRGAAMLREFEKLNTAATLGWRILFVTPDQLMRLDTVNLVKRCLNL